MDFDRWDDDGGYHHPRREETIMNLPNERVLQLLNEMRSVATRELNKAEDGLKEARQLVANHTLAVEMNDALIELIKDKINSEKERT